ncbi:hypothetical protein [uncultured Chryseobacterium sp.]|uniref:hypothetical protein n=1 Tax=uncultured Chryseobacterium sp. TaxID=259322 RepID=UPI0025F0AA25|nr:hypothetical protein [uncultured Chryseobacterium sp.]
MENIKFSVTGEYTFLISFGLGTFLFILFFITKNDFLLVYGFMYAIFAILVNVIVLYMNCLYSSWMFPKEKTQGTLFSFY